MRNPPESWRYLEEYGLYAHEHGDTNLNSFICTGVRRAITGMEMYEISYQLVHPWFNHTEDGRTYLTKNGTVVLQRVGEDYRFVSNTLHEARD